MKTPQDYSYDIRSTSPSTKALPRAGITSVTQMENVTNDAIGGAIETSGASAPYSSSFITGVHLDEFSLRSQNALLADHSLPFWFPPPPSFTLVASVLF